MARRLDHPRDPVAKMVEKLCSFDSIKKIYLLKKNYLV